MKFKVYDYEWQIYFVPREDEHLKGCCDGITLYNDMVIYIRNDLNKVMAKEVLIHELTHATLCLQGRCYQKTFKLEEVCEFVGYNAEMILKTAEKILHGRH